MKNIVKYGICLFCMLLSAAASADDFDSELKLPEEEYSAPAPTFLGGVTDKLRNLTFKDVLGWFKIGAKANLQYDNHWITDTSYKPVMNPVSGGRFDFGLNIGTPIGDIVLEYNMNVRDWNGKYSGSYFYSHFNFYNLHSVFGLDPFMVMWLPTGVYASGNSDQMVYRQMDWRLFNAVGYNETAYVFFDKENPGYSTYHADKRISLLSLKGLISSFADYDLFNFAYGNTDESLLNEFLLKNIGPLANFLPMPYGELFLTRSKLEHRYYSKILDTDDTGKYKFGWNLGFLYARSFPFYVGPGLLVVQPRVDVLLYDLGYHYEPAYYLKNDLMPGTDDQMPIKVGFDASVAVCYYF